MSNKLPTWREFWAKAEEVFRENNQYAALCWCLEDAANALYDLDGQTHAALMHRSRAQLLRFKPPTRGSHEFWWPWKPDDQPLDMPRLMVLRALQCEDRP